MFSNNSIGMSKFSRPFVLVVISIEIYSDMNFRILAGFRPQSVQLQIQSQDIPPSVLTSQKLWQPQVPFSSPPWAQLLLDPLEGWAGCSSSCPPSLHLLLLPSQFSILTLFPSLPFKLSSAVPSLFLSFASSFSRTFLLLLTLPPLHNSLTDISTS